jgi:hypothetical protein
VLAACMQRCPLPAVQPVGGTHFSSGPPSGADAARQWKHMRTPAAGAAPAELLARLSAPLAAAVEEEEEAGAAPGAEAPAAPEASAGSSWVNRSRGAPRSKYAK